MAIIKTANTTGKYHDLNSYYKIIGYISRSNKTIHGHIGYIGLDMHNPAGSMEAIAKTYNKENGVHVRHFIVAFEPTELSDPEMANLIGWEVINYFGEQYQAIFAVHEDEPQLHIHIIINAVSYVDGHKYRGTREEFHRFVAFVRSIVQRYGVNALYYVPNKPKSGCG